MLHHWSTMSGATFMKKMAFTRKALSLGRRKALFTSWTASGDDNSIDRNCAKAIPRNHVARVLFSGSAYYIRRGGVPKGKDHSSIILLRIIVHLRLSFTSLCQARSAQVPLIMSGKSMATSGTNFFNAAKALAANNKDPSGWQQLTQQAKAVADAMRRLITSIKYAQSLAK